MDMQIIGRNMSITERQREIAESRLFHALGRFASRIRTVKATISDVNGPKGGRGILCRLQITLLGKGQVVVGHKEVTLEAVVSRIADQAGRSVARVLDRQRRFQTVSVSTPEIWQPVE